MKKTDQEKDPYQHNLIDSISEAIISTSPDYRILSWNRAAEHIYGLTLEEVIGQPFAEVLQPEYVNETRDGVRNKLIQQGFWKGEQIHHRRDGTTVHVLSSVSTVYDSAGNPREIVSVNQDITDQLRDKLELIEYRDHLEERVKERTARLVESEARLRKHTEEISDLYNNAPCGYHSINADGYFVRINDTELKWLGYSREEIIGKKKLSDLLVPNESIPFITEFPDSQKQGIIQNIEGDMLRKDGTRLAVLINSSAVYDEGGNFFVRRHTFVDNTEHQLAQKALQQAKEAAESASRAKSIFLANMSHEIRTPMNAILGFSQLMLRDPAFPPAHKYHLETVNHSGEHLLELINDILEMSKIEAGRTSLNLSTFDLISMIHDLERLFHVQTRSKGLNFQVTIAPDLPQYVLADASKLRQIFINLLGNAVKFTDQGEINWRIRSEVSVSGARRLIAEVEDSGPGIAAEEMGKLFQAFGQTAIGELKGGGTGLGLAISAKFAQMMGGVLSASSQVGKGSLFRVELDLCAGRKQDITSERLRQRVARLSSNQSLCRILVVDDNPENRFLVLELLQSVGFSVGVACNGVEGIQAFLDWAPHLILMDIHMPVMDGYEAIRQIKAAEKGRRVPIIALTAYAFKEDEELALEAGADGFMSKPLKDFELFAAIQRHLAVEYEYAEPDSPAQPVEAGEIASLSAKTLAGLPVEMIQQIRQAILTANLILLLSLLDPIEHQAAEVANWLRQLANNYDYERLLLLLPGE